MTARDLTIIIGAIAATMAILFADPPRETITGDNIEPITIERKISRTTAPPTSTSGTWTAWSSGPTCVTSLAVGTAATAAYTPCTVTTGR